MKSKIVELIKSLGPIVPSEITSKLESNSVIISALISELIKEGVVKYSHKKIGSSPLYYLPGQENEVRKRLTPELKIPERKIVEFFDEKKLVLKNNLSPQQRFMVDDLKDFITPLTLNINGEDKIFYKHYSISTQAIYDDMNKKKIKPAKVKSEGEKVKQMSLFNSPAAKTENKIKNQEVLVEAKNELESFDDLSDQFFTQYNLTLLESEVIKKGKEANFVVKAGYRIPQKYFVKYYKKKNLNEKDVSKAYADSQVKKMPCLIITIGKFSKKAEKLSESLGNFVNIIKL
ncbi:MAG: hypothetical protein JW791_03765 [Nanoarchaeota archaeon]|nr:hypothetical protein [Nanoarchaeota archaeon]